jgi:aspartate ammonia-lyase
VGTGITAPRKYIFRVIDNLRSVSGLGVARAENLVEATGNNDVYAEVSGIMRSHAANLIKIGNDLRFLSSDACGEIKLKPLLRGSSIMPGKVNPVVPEMMVQAGMKVLGNDSTIAQAVAAGHLELNAFLPLIIFTMLESLELLTRVDDRAVEYCINGIMADERRIQENFYRSNAVVTVLVPYLGYSQAEKIWAYMRENQVDVMEANRDLQFISQDKLGEILEPHNLLKLGETD